MGGSWAQSLLQQVAVVADGNPGSCEHKTWFTNTKVTKQLEAACVSPGVLCPPI